MNARSDWTKAALLALNKKKLLLGMQDAAFPADSRWDIGRGTPYSAASRAFVRWAKEWGFTGLQMGPSGKTSAFNPSPYDGSWFERNPLNLSLEELVSGRVLVASKVQSKLARRPEESLGRVNYTFAEETAQALLQTVTNISRRLESQHEEFHRFAQNLSMSLFADMQIGLAVDDAHTFRHLLLPHVLMGAPPSRTNREGQAWNYPVFHPLQLIRHGRPGPVVELFRKRARRLLSEYDGIRIDHPHGLVDPWVYSGVPPVSSDSVLQGARLYSSPKHPLFGKFAIARIEQIDTTLPRYADAWVKHLSPEQTSRYGILLSAILDEVLAAQRTRADMVCEVLSTQPYPLAEVMRQHGLGRFRVISKANPHDTADVYHPRRAAPEDWLMLGNHDTPSIWQTLKQWRLDNRFARWVDYLVQSLEPQPSARLALARRFQGNDSLMVHALLAEMLKCRAENIIIFFTDVFGMVEQYNEPGTTHVRNWTLRVPSRFADEGQAALQLPLSLVWALRSERHPLSQAPFARSIWPE